MIFSIFKTDSNNELPAQNAIYIEKTQYGSKFEIEINTLEELINLEKEVENPIIIGSLNSSKDKYSIEIYNGYRE